MSARARLALGALALALGGCTMVGPDYHLPKWAVFNQPQAQAPFDAQANPKVSQAALPADWWQLYHEPLLDHLVQEALAKNTDVRLAYHNLRRAYESYQMAHHANEVEFGGKAASGRGQVSSEALGEHEQLPVMNLSSAVVGIGYQVDLFGKLKRAAEAAGAGAEASQAALDAARISVVAQVVGSYMDSCHASEELEIAEHSLNIQERQLEVAQRLLAGGRGNEIDVARAQAQTEALRAQLPPYEAKKASALYALAALLGRTPGDLPAGVAACKHAPQLAAALPTGDGAALLKRRPDIRAAERELAAATAEIGVATAALYPEISLGANFGYTGMTEHMGSAITREWALMPSISWHIPTKVDHARIRATEAGADAALARFDGVVLAALRETQTLLSHYAHNLKRSQSLRQARDAARAGAEYNRRLYREGRMPYLDSLDADRTLAEAEAALAAAQAQLSTDQVNLFLSLGGGWENARDSAGQEPRPAAKH
ncbi:efflux transporter outer membrane subunit [Pseudomonas sp. MAP12]|uniref:Efflux transporter outer membrane subunit n=1 Tax=Geopseudomonas aromaticivorans TaxID=2849492 RepID=A0ABS6MZU0_9GAMM|nr:efflux transporter outer membrane subunit [Pseudomonas aromaticivorans]MBV2134055.1 efflux transporter outer membrane subunit [Pseudomonas aromaticivorans]